MRKRLRDKLPNELRKQASYKIYSSFDIVGDLAIIKTSHLNSETAQAVAKQILATHKNVKSVYTQTSAIKSGFRIRELKLLIGESNTLTTHKESGCTFHVDIAQCYFSPRLSYERARIAKLVHNGETVVNMFAGVGCFSIIVVKVNPQTRVYSIDVNPVAYEYMEKNIELNHVSEQVEPIFGDARVVIETKLSRVADRVLMPLPELAPEYLPAALSALKQSGGWVHYHDFEHATSKEDPVEKSKQKVAGKLDSLGVEYDFASARVVRSIGPNWWHIVLDIQVTTLPSKF